MGSPNSKELRWLSSKPRFLNIRSEYLFIFAQRSSAKGRRYRRLQVEPSALIASFPKPYEGEYADDEPTSSSNMS